MERTIEEALDRARRIDRGQGIQVLITGSLHLVGGALCLLEPDENTVYYLSESEINPPYEVASEQATLGAPR